MGPADLAVALWASIWLAVAGAIAYNARQGNRLSAAAWMISIAAFLAFQEDPGLLLNMASITPTFDRDGVLGVVNAHTRAHMYGASVLAIGGLVMCVWIAWAALRRGERWAWNAVLVFLVLGAAADVSEVLFIYPHGFPLGATPSDGIRGFGWASIAAWIVIWAAALWYSRPRLKPVPLTEEPVP
jgi:hypothetical protein